MVQVKVYSSHERRDSIYFIWDTSHAGAEFIRDVADMEMDEEVLTD